MSRYHTTSTNTCIKQMVICIKKELTRLGYVRKERVIQLLKQNYYMKY